MKISALLTLLLLASPNVNGQNLIGFKGNEIKKYMKENHRDMSPSDFKNSKFIYLKYSDFSESQTLLFFLNKDSVCNSIRLVCDLGVKKEKIKEYNTIYKRNGDNKWIDRRNGKNYLIEIKDELYSCIVTIEPDN